MGRRTDRLGVPSSELKACGTVLFIERQVAHVWGGAIAATIGVFVIEILLGMEVLSWPLSWQ